MTLEELVKALNNTNSSVITQTPSMAPVKHNMTRNSTSTDEINQAEMSLIVSFSIFVLAGILSACYALKRHNKRRMELMERTPNYP